MKKQGKGGAKIERKRGIFVERMGVKGSRVWGVVMVVERGGKGKGLSDSLLLHCWSQWCCPPRVLHDRCLRLDIYNIPPLHSVLS